MGPSEAYKNKIGLRVMTCLEDALTKGEITEEEASSISSYLLENIDKAKNNAELIDFLADLSKNWPFFSQILTIEQGEILDKKEDQAAEQVSGLIKENKLDEALRVAENATDQKIQEVN